MPLPKPVTRRHIHSRDILCRGFQREDGLWDIEATLTDTKTYSFDNVDRNGINAGEPIHLLAVRVTLDEAMTVRAIEAVLDAGPFKACALVPEEALRHLVGIPLGAGWRKAVRRALDGREGCTHITEMLLGPIATTAHQAVRAARQRRHATDTGSGKPPLVDSCHALASDGPAVRHHWPDYYTGR